MIFNTVSPNVELLSIASYIELLTVVRFSIVPPSILTVPPSLEIVYIPTP